MNGKLVIVPARIVDGVIPERDIRDRGIVEPVGQLRLLERLGADVGIGIQRLGNAGGQRINLDTGDRRAVKNSSGISPMKWPMPHAGSNPASLKTEPRQRL